jgi:hypothetical protein
MQTKILLFLAIIVLITLMLFIKHSSRRLWQKDNSLNSRIFTWRSIALIIIIILFLFFSLIR